MKEQKNNKTVEWNVPGAHNTGATQGKCLLIEIQVNDVTDGDPYYK